MPTEQARTRQVEQALSILIDEATAFLACHPILACHMKHCADLLGALDKHRLWALELPTDHGRSLAPHDCGLLAGDFFQGVAEEIRMVQGYRRNDAGKRLRHHIGGIEPAAEP